MSDNNVQSVLHHERLNTWYVCRGFSDTKLRFRRSWYSLIYHTCRISGSILQVPTPTWFDDLFRPMGRGMTRMASTTCASHESDAIRLPRGSKSQYVYEDNNMNNNVHLWYDMLRLLSDVKPHLGSCKGFVRHSGYVFSSKACQTLHYGVAGGFLIYCAHPFTRLVRLVLGGF